MANVTENKINIDLNVMPRKTKKAFVFLSEQEWLSKSGWYLAGGTALALSSKYRKSVDLDFFTKQRDIDNKEIIDRFSKNKDWETYINKEKTIYGTLFGAKMSFIAYPFFIPKQKFIKYGYINILHPKDIAVMKIVAISQRGKKRDFFDLYWCIKNIESLQEIILRLPDQYPSVAHDYHHILKSLMYFEDANEDSTPETNFKATWNQVKNYFQKEIPIITKNLVIKAEA